MLVYHSWRVQIVIVFFLHTIGCLLVGSMYLENDAYTNVIPN